jgi:hypothetical protein
LTSHAALSRMSWDRTWEAMARLVDAAIAERLGLDETAERVPAAGAAGAE